MSDEGETTSEATVSTLIDEIPTETQIDMTEEAPIQLGLFRQNAIQAGGRYKSKRRKLRKSIRTNKNKRRITKRNKRRKHVRSRRH